MILCLYKQRICESNDSGLGQPHCNTRGFFCLSIFSAKKLNKIQQNKKDDSSQVSNGVPHSVTSHTRRWVVHQVVPAGESVCAAGNAGCRGGKIKAKIMFRSMLSIIVVAKCQTMRLQCLDANFVPEQLRSGPIGSVLTATRGGRSDDMTWSSNKKNCVAV